MSIVYYGLIAVALSFAVMFAIWAIPAVCKGRDIKDPESDPPENVNEVTAYRA
jgi:hypothetical protein